MKSLYRSQEIELFPVHEIQFVPKIKGDATSLILLNIQKLTTVYFKIHNRYDWEILKVPHIIFEIMGS